MAWHIYPKEISGHKYYYAQRSWREKVSPTECGKRGKSRVRTETLYLGTADAVVAKFKEDNCPSKCDAASSDVYRPLPNDHEHRPGEPA